MGIAVDRKIGKFNITGGFNYFNVRENYSFPDQVDTTLEIQDNSFWTVVDNGFWKYTDSILVQKQVLGLYGFHSYTKVGFDLQRGHRHHDHSGCNRRGQRQQHHQQRFHSPLNWI